MSASWESLRNHLVTELRSRGIHDRRVLAAIRQVPRHLFVLPEQAPRAYDDRSLPIRCNQTISQPFIVALALQRLGLTGAEKILEVGTGSGYQAALLGHLCRQVETLEIIPELIEEARARLANLSMSHVRVHLADGFEGWQKEAPYNAIVVAAATPEISPAWVEQLKPQGKLIVPLGVDDRQTLTLIRKQDKKIVQEPLCSCIFVPLTGQHLS